MATSAKDGPGFRAAEGQGGRVGDERDRPGRGSGRPGAGPAPAPDGGHSLPLAEPGTRGEYLVERDRALRVADLGHQVGLPWSQHRPRPPPSPLPEACGRPASSAACSGSPSANASRANATRHSAMLRLMWIARLSSSASSRSARAPASWPPATSRVPTCTRDQAASQVSPDRSGRSCASCTPPPRDTVADVPCRGARRGSGRVAHVIHSRPAAEPDGQPSVPASNPVTGDYPEVAVKRSADCMQRQRFRCSPAYTR